MKRYTNEQLELYTEILKADRNTTSEIEKRLKNGTFTIYEDFEENFKNYMEEWYCDEDEIENFQRMIDDKVALEDWSITEYNGKTYYIAYEN